MKNFAFFLLILISYSCKKNKLNQPCTLNFQSDYISSSNPNDEKFSGSLNVTRITFSGQRQEGDPVAIEKEFSAQTMTVGAGVVFDMPIDIPVGTYTSYNVKLRLSPANSLRLIKNVTNGSNKPIIIEINDDINLVFEADEISPELEKESNYTAKLIWNFNSLFAGLSNQGINSATTTMIDGVETVVINESSNSDLLEKINLNLPKAIKLKIE